MTTKNYTTKIPPKQEGKTRQKITAKKCSDILDAFDEGRSVDDVVEQFGFARNTMLAFHQFRRALLENDTEVVERLQNSRIGALCTKVFESRYLPVSKSTEEPSEAQQPQEPLFPWPEPNWTDLLIARLGDIAIVAGRIVDQLREINEKL